ncbi:hypothetical protein TFLX_02198 [Thermoflexales bacterium]|nr:hypothetical protein TFLX_02198 [Thermoflexales bacterium]
MNLLKQTFILRIRRNHALEHATIHVLTATKPGRPLAGRSTSYGFYLYGDVSDEELQTAVSDARNRLKRGESRLAIHPGCGTNYLASGAAASLGALTVLSLGDRKAHWSRLPDVLIAATLALIAAQPVGPKLQEHITTCADVGDLEIVAVRGIGVKAYYVKTHST